MNSIVLRRLAICVALLLYCLMAATNAHRPLYLDSADFAGAAKAVAETGKPIFYRGEDDPAELALWHPPLYVCLLAGWFKIFGSGASQACTFGLLCTILQGLVVLAIARTLFGRRIGSSIQPWFWMVFLLNPYTLQGAAILDIDTTIYGPLLCLLLLLTLRLTWREGRKRQDTPTRIEYVWIAVLVAVALWAKMTTIIAVAPFLFLLLIGRLGLWRAVRVWVFIVSGGLATFLITYWVYCAASNLPADYSYRFLVYRFQSVPGGHPGLFGRLLDFRDNASFMVPFMVRWTGLLPWLGLAASILVACWIAFRNKNERAQHFALCMLLGIAVTLYYCGQTTTWGNAPFKYTFVFWGLILLAPLLLCCGKGVWDSSNVDSSMDLCIAAPALQIGMTVVFLASIWYGRYVLEDRHLLEYHTPLWLVWAPAILLLPAIYSHSRSNASVSLRVAPLAGICVWAGVQLGVAIFQLSTPYSTNYDYGQAGIEDAAAFLRVNSPNEVFSSMKDLGYLTRLKYYDDYAAVNVGGDATGALIDALTKGRVKLAVFTEQFGQDRLTSNPVLQKWVQQNCTPVAAFGDYRIYRFRLTLPSQ